MASFENKQGITEIRLYEKVHSFCPMGNDWYDAELEIIFQPLHTIMDYCDVDKFFESINGSEAIIEDLVDHVFDYFNTYAPMGLSVIAKVDNATHLPVIVKKEHCR